VIHPYDTLGSGTLSVTIARRSAWMGDVVTDVFGTSGPRFSGPKYFVTSVLARPLSMSPTMVRLALFGV